MRYVKNTFSFLGMSPALLWVILVIYILIFLKPFGINYNSINLYHFSLLAGYGILSFFPVILFETHYQKIDKRNKLKSFLTGAVFTLFIISMIVWRYSHLLHIIEPRFNFPAFPYLEALFNTITIGTIPLAIRALWIFSQQKSATKELPHVLQLFSMDNKDWFKVESSKLLYFKSCDNYVEILHIAVDGKIIKTLLRTTLSSIEKQLNSNSFMRCHRSFIINVHKVSKAEGNSKSMNLSMLGLDYNIPVSRARISEIQQRFELLHFNRV